ncbi:MAG: glycoside hydrolase family 16 protein [Bryobacter sp.]|nr:glycoside hydrolase family 16 protein [Bryobacter sp.]
MKSRMVRLIAIAAAAALSCLAAPPEGYRLVWADEFDGKSLDTAKWNYRTDSKHWSTQKPENIAVANGNLALLLKKEKAGDKEYTGAGVISKPAFRFGYYESRFRIDAGKGWHSSFWMMGHDGSGGTGTTKTALELDVIENDSINLNSYGVNLHKWQGQHVSYGHKNVATSSLAEYHVFGCLYTPEKVTYYLDGQPVQTVDVAALPHGDLHIWLTSIASYLGKTDAVDESRLPGRVLYDYVRFYEKGK